MRDRSLASETVVIRFGEIVSSLLNARARRRQQSRFILQWPSMTEKKSAGKTSAELKAARQLRLPDLLRGPFDIKSFALTGLFVLAVFYTMYFMRAMLLPLVLALLLSYLLAPLVRLLGRIRVKPAFGAAIVLLSLVGLVIYGISRLAEPAAGWLEKAPYSLQQLQQQTPAAEEADGKGRAGERRDRQADFIRRNASEDGGGETQRARRCLPDPDAGVYRERRGHVHPALFPSRLRRSLSREDHQGDPAFGGQETRRLDRARDRDADFALPLNHYPDQYRAWAWPLA